MHLHVRVLWKVDYVLERLTTDHDLALNRFSRICFSIELYLTIHGLHISPHLQIGEYFDKLAEVFSYQIDDSIVGYLNRARRWFVTRLIKMLLREGHLI